MWWDSICKRLQRKQNFSFDVSLISILWRGLVETLAQAHDVLSHDLEPAPTNTEHTLEFGPEAWRGRISPPAKVVSLYGTKGLMVHKISSSAPWQGSVVNF